MMALPTRQTRRPAPLEGTTQNAQPWLMLAVLLLGQFMCLIDVMVVNVAMPSIAASLHASGASLQLIVGGYTIAYAMLLLPVPGSATATGGAGPTWPAR